MIPIVFEPLNFYCILNNLTVYITSNIKYTRKQHCLASGFPIFFLTVQSLFALRIGKILMRLRGSNHCRLSNYFPICFRNKVPRCLDTSKEAWVRFPVRDSVQYCPHSVPGLNCLSSCFLFMYTVRVICK